MKRHAIALAVCAAIAACNGGPSTEDKAPAVAPAALGPVVFVGDSITAHWYDPAIAGSHTLADLVPGSVDAGIPGNTTAQMLARFDADALAHRPAVVVILGGTNDLYLEPDAATVDNIAAMAERASAAGAAVVIGLTTPTNDWQRMRYAGKAGNAAVRAWDADLRTLAHAYGYAVADYYAELIEPSGAEDRALFGADGVHPDAAGYAHMWKALRPLIVGHLQDSGG